MTRRPESISSPMSRRPTNHASESCASSNTSSEANRQARTNASPTGPVSHRSAGEAFRLSTRRPWHLVLLLMITIFLFPGLTPSLRIPWKTKFRERFAAHACCVGAGAIKGKPNHAKSIKHTTQSARRRSETAQVERLALAKTTSANKFR